MAALDSALHAALSGLPAEQARELKHRFGRAMGEIVTEIITPAILAFPELALDDGAWAAIAKERARQRSVQFSGNQDGPERG